MQWIVYLLVSHVGKLGRDHSRCVAFNVRQVLIGIPTVLAPSSVHLYSMVEPRTRGPWDTIIKLPSLGGSGHTENNIEGHKLNVASLKMLHTFGNIKIAVLQPYDSVLCHFCPALMNFAFLNKLSKALFLNNRSTEGFWGTMSLE